MYKYAVLRSPAKTCGKAALVAIIVLACNMVNAMEKVPLVTGEWVPYTTSLDDKQSSGIGGGYGLITEIVTAVLRDMGLQPEYRFASWFEIPDLLNKGDFKYTFPYRKTTKREENYIFSDSLFKSHLVFFYNITSIPNPSTIKTLDDLEDQKVGFIKGYEYENEFKSKFKKIRVFSSDFAAFKNLIKRDKNLGKSEEKMIICDENALSPINCEIDVLPSELIAGETIVKRYFRDDQHKLARLPNSNLKFPNSVHLMAPKGDAKAKQFIDRFNKSLARIRSSGVHRELTSRYQVRSESMFMVRLIGPSNLPVAIGTINPEDKKGFLIPRGTSAVVVEWNTLFTEEGDFDVHTDMYEKSRVKILEGPLKDHLLWVPNMFLTFE